jgi:hypothetical protein
LVSGLPKIGASRTRISFQHHVLGVGDMELVARDLRRRQLDGAVRVCHSAQ